MRRPGWNSFWGLYACLLYFSLSSKFRSADHGEIDQARVGSELPKIRAGFVRCAGSMESLWTIPVGAFGWTAVRAWTARRSSRTFRAAAILKPLRPNIPACQAIARGEPAFVLIAARRSERIRTSRILSRFQFGGGSGDLVQDPRRRTKKTAGITEPAKFITNREE